MRFGFDNGGQTCNVFWSYVALINKSIAQNKRYVIPIFEKTIRHYPDLLKCKYLSFPFHNRLFIALFGERKSRSLAIHCFKNPFVNYDSLCNNHPELFVNGYDIHNEPLSDECKAVVRQLFIPSTDISNTVKRLFEAKRKQYDKIIGVHIRRGDYESWKNGLFFFDFETYSQICDILFHSFSNERICFFMASTDNIPVSVFNNIPFFQTPDQTVTQDLYALSLCDCVIGPPSTFSRFAAFRGNIPIAFIVDRNQTSFNFRILDNSCKYENGDSVDDDFVVVHSYDF